ncbi:hypothetical protein B9G69_013750 [Bdellovibrio sp. SKB1291214]|uniref:hypothetical protein n=1 Tax=Bdellovibrio sp. SKB1291214 TaxID=1732569 RepID=UPI0011324B0A|nr:hypothetical protein [Bdellovibrio sp. SKB1291214]UYL08110.1 hypothetical protein B9G69_013750 [Bdellovibrio sp. SKB1291214]
MVQKLELSSRSTQVDKTNADKHYVLRHLTSLRFTTGVTQMADKKFEKQIPNNVVSLAAEKCCGEGCKKKAEKASFCAEHFMWFKEGLITKEGAKAADFDKKYYQFVARKAA